MNAQEKIIAQQAQIDILSETNTALYHDLIQARAERDIAVEKINEVNALMSDIRAAKARLDSQVIEGASND